SGCCRLRRLLGFLSCDFLESPDLTSVCVQSLCTSHADRAPHRDLYRFGLAFQWLCSCWRCGLCAEAEGPVSCASSTGVTESHRGAVWRSGGNKSITSGPRFWQCACERRPPPAPARCYEPAVARWWPAVEHRCSWRDDRSRGRFRPCTLAWPPLRSRAAVARTRG